MDAQELLAQARDAMTARRVFGEPIDRDGTMLLPVASVMGGAGGGAGRAGTAGSAGTTGTGEGEAAGESATAPEEGSGYGFGIVAKPVGVYVIRGDQVTWQPAVDRNRQLMLGAIVSVLAILAVRSVLLAIFRR